MAAARAAADETEAELHAVAARRERAEHALASRGSEREGLANRFYAARSAHERIGLREEAARQAISALSDRAARRPGAACVVGRRGRGGRRRRRGGGADRRLEAELTELADDRRARIERELAELRVRREEAARLEGSARARRGGEARGAADAAADEAAAPAASSRPPPSRPARRRAPVPSWRSSTSSCAPTPAPRRRGGFADDLRADPGYELALAAALGPRLRAAVATDLAEGGALLDRAGRDGGAALIAARDGSSPVPEIRRRPRPAPSPS